MKGADQGAHKLFPVGPAENVGIGGDVGTVTGMTVVIDDGACVMEKAGGCQYTAHSVVETVRLFHWSNMERAMAVT